MQGGNLTLNGAAAAIDNQGTIHASMGDVYLIANQVSNEGTINAPHGTVGLAAGTDILFQQSGSNHLFVQATPSGAKRAVGVTNAGTINAAAAELKAAGGNTYALAINNTGLIAATGFKKIDGNVYLTSDGGSISNSGTISAHTANGNGGTIVVDGTAVRSTVSGVVTNSGTLNASATVAGGKGGSVTLKNLGGRTVHAGSIVAKGGKGGVGGNAEVSGATLSFTGTVDLTAQDGQLGNLLLDPTTIDIVTGGGANLNGSTIDPSAVVSALNSANLTLTASSSITVSNLVDASTNSGAGNLTLNTPTLDLNAPILLEGSSTLSGSATTINVGAGGSVQNAVNASGAAPTINLAAGATYGLTSEVTIAKNLTLNGNNAVLDGSNGAGVGNGVTRDMEIDGTVAGVTVTVNNLTLENGNGTGTHDTSNGGGLLVFAESGNKATVTLTDCTLTGNTTPYPNSYGYYGGGVYNDGSSSGNASLTLNGCTFTDNSGYYGGGIANEGYSGSGTLTLETNNTFSGNTSAARGADVYDEYGAVKIISAGGTSATINSAILATGSTAVLTVDPTLTTLTVDAPLINTNGATLSSSATTVNVGAGAGAESGSLVQTGLNLLVAGGTLNLASGSTYLLDSTTGEIVIGKNLTVNGNNAILDGSNGAGADNGVTRVMEIDGSATGVTVTVNNLTLENGNGAGPGANSANDGGGLLIYAENSKKATVTLNNCTISGCSTPSPNSYGYCGGGIFNDGYDYGNATLTLSNCTITDNAGYYGGGIANDADYYGSATTTIKTNDTFSGNTSPTPGYDFYNEGGSVNLVSTTGTTMSLNVGIYNTGSTAVVTVDPTVTTLNVNAPVVSVNNATVSGSATTVNVGAPTGGVESGYLVESGIDLSSFGGTVNFAAGSTYELDGTVGEIKIGHSLTLNGNGAILDGSDGAGAGNGVTRVMEIDGTTAGVTVAINHLTLQNGNGSGPGANNSTNGGGLLIFAENGNNATVTLNTCTISGNTASSGGGGIYVDGYDYGNAALTVSNCTITGNTASSSSYYGYGGGIYNDGYYNGNASLTVTNSTISGNTGSENGGLYNYYGTIVGTLTNAEVFGNTATATTPGGEGADIENFGTGTFEIGPDVVGGHVATINGSIISNGSGAVIAIDPAVTTLDLNEPVQLQNGSTVTSSVATINVAAGSGSYDQYILNSAVALVSTGGAVNLASGSTYGLSNELLIGQSLTLNGNGAILDGSNGAGVGNGVARVMEINGTAGGTTVTLNHLTLENGNGSGSEDSGDGAGLLIFSENSDQATVTLNNCTITDNEASYYGGGIYNDGYDYGNASLTVNNCTITGNTISSSYYGGDGAGIYNEGGDSGNATLTVTNSTITGNSAVYNGGIDNDSGTIVGSVTTKEVYGNTASGTTAGSEAADFENLGTGTIEILPDVAGGHVATINGSMISSGTGAVILVAPTVTTLDLNTSVQLKSGSTVTSSVATVNVAAGSGSYDQYMLNGAAALVGGGGTVNLTADSTYGLSGELVIGQSLTLNGNAAILDGSNGAGLGNSLTRAIEIDGTTAGVTVNLNNLTIENGNGQGGNNYENGGGLLIYAENGNHAAVTINNCAFSNNVTSSYYGGAIYNDGYYYGDSTLTLNNCTFTGNSTAQGTNSVVYNEGYDGSATLNLGAGDTTLTLNYSITNDGGSGIGTGAVIALDPGVATVNIDAPVINTSSATITSSATTVNVAAGSGTENGYLVKAGIAFAASGGTVNLADATYDLDNSTGEILIGRSLTLNGNGAVLDGSAGAGSGHGVVRVMEIDGTSAGVTVNLNALTIENGNGIGGSSYQNGGGLLVFAESGNLATVTLNNCMVTGNATQSYYGGGIYNDGDNGNAVLTLNNCTVSGNSTYTGYGGGGGIYNEGSGGSATLTLVNTTVTGNTGYVNGGIYNDSGGTITNPVDRTVAYGNTATATLNAIGADFYNLGTGTYVFKPDTAGGHTTTVNESVFSSGANAVLTVDPSVTNLIINDPVTTANGAVVNTSATTVSVGPGSGTENGYLVQSGLTLAASGATVSLASGTTYDFDSSTGGLSIGKDVTLSGNGAILNDQSNYANVISFVTGADTVTINNLTVENGSEGISLYYYNPSGGVSLNLNNLTITGNTSEGLYDANYYGYADTVNLTNCTISGNGTTNGGQAGGIYNSDGALTLTNCTISGNGNATEVPSAGGIYNSGTLNLDSATTITGNTGYYAGGIYNNGTIVGTVNSSQVHGNTATNANLTNVGTDFYNTGTATFVYNPDGETNNTRTITAPIYSYGAGAVITIDPTIQTLDVNADVNSSYSATFNSSATTVNLNAPMQTIDGIYNSAATAVNVAAGTGTENGYYVEGGVELAGNGATVTLATGAAYKFDGTTGGVTINQNLTLNGRGATLDGQGDGVNLINLAGGANTVTVNNLTVENGSTGVDLYYYNSTGGSTLNLNNVTITGNSTLGLNDSNYYSYANTVNLSHCIVSGNDISGYSSSAGGIYNSNGTLTLTSCTITGNGNASDAPQAGGIYNSGTLNLDGATTITGNTGSYTGGIYNYGTIVGAVNSSQVNANTETSATLTNAGADFYNTGTATFVYQPDGETNNTRSITAPIYSYGAGAVITIDPTIQALDINAPVVSTYGATFNSSAATVNINAPMRTASGVFNSSATTVNVAAGSGTENGYYVEGGVALAGSGATVNLAPGTTYDFDGNTSGLNIGQSLTLAGNGATFDDQANGESVIALANGANVVTVNNLTVQNGSTGVSLYFYNPNGGVTLNLNNVTITGNSNIGLNNTNYNGYLNTVNLSDCTITGNDTTGYSSSAGGIYNGSGTLTLTNCTVTGNGNTSNAPTAGGIENDGTLNFDSATTVTGNTGRDTGGIYNGGTIVGPVDSTQVHGNTATNLTVGQSGSDFYNTGTATFVYKPDGEPNNTLTITQSIYSSGAGAAITVDPSIQTLNVDTEFSSTNSAEFNSSAGTININAPVVTTNGIFNSAATVVNVAAGSGTENGYLAEGGVALAGPGATVNLAANTTYNFDNTTGGMTIGQSLTLAGAGATLNAQGNSLNVVSLANGASTVNLNNLTVENGGTGITLDYYNPTGGATMNLNNVTITGNTGTAFYDANYNGYSNVATLTNCTLNNNDTSSAYTSAGGIYNGNGTLTVTNSTISNNGNVTYPPGAGGIENEGVLNLTQTTISGNRGSDAGGIYNVGTLTETDCSFSGNTSSLAHDTYNSGTETIIADANATVPNTINYTTSDINYGRATYQATTINWNVPFTNNGTLTIDPTETGSVTINSPITNSGGPLLIQSPVITLNAAITSSYGDIVLNDSTQFVNTVGSGALSASNGYTWQVWSANPAGSGQSTVDNDGGLVPNYIQYNATYGVTTPAAAGNGLLYSYAATVGANLTGPYTKTYDGTTALALAANSYTTTGLVTGDSIVNLALTGNFNSKDVDSATTLTVTATALTSSVTHGSIPVYGYTGGTTSAGGTITPATITAGLTGTVTKTYDASTAATLDSSNYTLSGVLSGDSVALNDPTSGTYSTPNVGTNIPVTVSGLNLQGAQADDYALASTTVSGPIGVINAAGINAILGYLTGTVSKVYDGTLTVSNLTSANYALSGVMGSDNVVLTGPTTGTYASANVGTGITVTSSTGLVLSGAQAGNYYLTNTQATGAIGIITPAPLTVTTSAVTKTYDGTDIAPGSPIVTSGTLYTNAGTGVRDSLGAGIFTFTNPNAGTGDKTVTVSGVTISDGNGGGNYVVTYVDNTTSTINPAALTISTNPVTKTYDGTDTALGTASVVSGTLYTNASTGLQDNLSGGTFAFTNPNAGSGDKVVTVSGVTVNDGNGGGNYTVSFANNTTSTINPAALTITTNAVTKTYDGTDSASGTVTLSSGTLYNNVGTGLQDSLSGGTIAFTDPNAGSGDKTLTVSGITVNDGNGGANYAISYVNNNSGTINPAAITITTSAVTKTYDGTTSATGSPTLTAGTLYTNVGTGVHDSLSGGTYAFTDPNAGTGDKTVTVNGVTVSDGNGGGNYTVTYANNTTSTINPAVVTAALTGTVTKVYDTTTSATLDSANYTLSGVVNGDSISLNDPTSGTYSTPNAGINIPVTVTGLALLGTKADDYVLASTTITGPVGIINAAGVNAVLGYLTGTVSKVYDGTLAVTNLTSANYALSGVMGSDDVVLTGPATGTYATANVGTGITVTSSTGLALSGAQASNYYLTNTQATGPIGIITPAPLTVTTTAVTKSYDGTTSAAGSATLASGTLYTNVGTGVQDSLSGGTFAFTDPNAGAGNKTVTVGGVTVSDGNGGGNYTITYANNTTSTITPAQLTYTSNPVSSIYGSTPSSFSGTVTGFVNGDTLATATTGTLTFTSTATPSTGVGSYAINGGGLAANSGNYIIGQAAGNATALTITPATLTYTANTATNTYGSTPTGLGGTVAGFVNNDTLANATSGTLVFTTTATALSGVGTYAITGAGLTAANYTLTQAGSNATALTVNPAPLAITANNQTKTYGQTLSFAGTEFSSTPLQNGETIGSVTLSSAGAAAGAMVDGSPYAITIGSATGGTFAPANYAITYTPGLLTVNQAILSYVAVPLSLPYNSAIPTSYSGAITGLVNGDTLAEVTSGTATYATTASSDSGPGSYAITGSGVSVLSANYASTIAQDPGNYTALTIMPPASTTTTTNISTTTGGAADAGSNIVPPVVNVAPVVVAPPVQLPPSAPGGGTLAALPPEPLNQATSTPGSTTSTSTVTATDSDTLGDLAPAIPPPISFVGTGVAAQIGQQTAGIVNSSGNSGQVTSGDVAQLGDGQLSNVANPHASGALNQALGPVVFHTLQDALQAAGDVVDAAAAGPDSTDAATTEATTAPAASGDDETILSGGDVAEVADKSTKKIPLNQAPPELQRALAGDVYKGLGGGGR